MKTFKKILPIIFGVIAALLSSIIGTMTGINFIVYAAFDGQENLSTIILLIINLLIGFVVYKISKAQIQEKN